MKKILSPLLLTLAGSLHAGSDIIAQPYVPLWVYLAMAAMIAVTGLFIWRYHQVVGQYKRMLEKQRDQNESLSEFREKLEGLKTYLESLHHLRGRIQFTLDTELRTPLARIEQNLRLLSDMDTRLDDDQRIELVSDLKQHIELMVNILRGVLKDLAGTGDLPQVMERRVN